MIHLARVRIKQIINHLKRARIRTYLIFLPLGACFLAALGYVFSLVFGYLANHPDLPADFKLFLAEKILMMVFLTLFVMLILSAMVATMNIFFLSKDLPLLISSPIAVGAVFRWKLIETVINSGGMVVIFALPVLIVFCSFFTRGTTALLAVFFVFFLFVLCSIFVAILIGLLIPTFFSVNRAQPFFSLVSILLISGLVIILRMLRPERFLQPGAIENLYEFMRSMDVDRFAMLPFYWVSRSIASVSRSDTTGYWNPVLLFILVLAAITVVMGLYSRKWYLRLIDRHSEGASRSKRSGWFRRSNRRKGFGLLFKEVKTFIRTPTQWSQLIIIGAMVVVFILNLRSIPTPHPSVTLLVAFLNMGLAVFVAIGLNSRFVFTTIPGEGDGLIHLLASPYTKSRFLRFKLVFYLVPQLVIGFSLFFIGDTMLGLDPFFRFAGVIFLLPVLVFLTVLALYLGLFVNSRSSISPQHLLLTLPGISYMLGSIVYTICCLVFFSRPLFLFYFNIYRWKPVPFGTIFLWIAFFLAVNAALIFLIYTRAQSRWAQRELP